MAVLMEGKIAFSFSFLSFCMYTWAWSKAESTSSPETLGRGMEVTASKWASHSCQEIEPFREFPFLLKSSLVACEGNNGIQVQPMDLRAGRDLGE